MCIKKPDGRNTWSINGFQNSINVSVATNQASWSAISNQSWLTAARVGDGLRLTASSNNGAARTATVIVTAGGLSEIITVTQGAFIPPIVVICPVCEEFELDEDGVCPMWCIIHIRRGYYLEVE